MEFNDKKNKLFISLSFIACVVLIIFILFLLLKPTNTNNNNNNNTQKETNAKFDYEEYLNNNDAKTIINDYAKKNNIDVNEYPEKLIELLDNEKKSADYVLNYPTKKFTEANVELTQEEKETEEMPLFIQWDKRWGYKKYGNDAAGLTACGPTALSMVAFHLTGNKDLTPDKIMDFAVKNGYCIDGVGSSWELISKGSKKLGLNAKELPLVEKTIIKNLEKGNPVICVVGPGHFTKRGHFIVMYGYKDGKIMVKDPNSYKNSEKLYEFSEIKDEIKNLWAISK